MPTLTPAERRRRARAAAEFAAETAATVAAARPTTRKPDEDKPKKPKPKTTPPPSRGPESTWSGTFGLGAGQGIVRKTTPAKPKPPPDLPRHPVPKRKFPVLTDMGFDRKDAEQIGTILQIPPSLRSKMFTKETNAQINKVERGIDKFIAKRREIQAAQQAARRAEAERVKSEKYRLEHKYDTGPKSATASAFGGLATPITKLAGIFAGEGAEAGEATTDTVAGLAVSIGRKGKQELEDIKNETWAAIKAGLTAEQAQGTSTGPLATIPAPAAGVIAAGKVLEPGGRRGVSVAGGLAKALGAGGAAIAGAPAHPIRTVEEALAILKGSGQGVALAGYLLTQPLDRKTRWKLIDNVVDATLEDIVARYGPDVTFREALRRGYDEPVISFLNAVAVVAPAAKSAAVLRAMRSGVGFRTALRISRNPELAGDIRRLTVTDKEGPVIRRVEQDGEEVHVPYEVEVSQSQSPVMRGIGKGRDVVSKQVAERVNVPLPGGRRFRGTNVPFVGQSRRALVAQRRNLRRNTRRLAAEGAALYTAVQDFIGKGESAEARKARLFWNMERPVDIPEETWLKALADDMTEMLEGREVITPGSISAAEQKLINRVNRFKAKADRAARDRWLRRVEDIDREQERLRAGIVAINEDMRDIRARMRDLDDDPDMDDADRSAAHASLEDELEELQFRRRSLKNDLDPLEPDPVKAVSSARRDEVAATLERLPRITPDEAEDILALLDAHSRSWAKLTGRTAADWWDAEDGFGVEAIRLIEDKADLPEGALRQERSPDVSNLDVERLRDAAYEGVDMSVFREHNIDEFLENIPSYLQRGAPYRRWYETSGKQILEFAGGDKDLAAKIAQLAAIYSASRKPTENINLALQAYRQWQQRGKIEGVATAPQDRKANAVMRGENWEGRKTNRFYANMLKWIDEDRYLLEFEGGEVTNDIWMARLFGLKTDVPTPREYAQMTRIQQNIARELGWSPEEIQAALWVPAKADAGRTVTGKGGKKVRVPMEDSEAGIDFATALRQEAGIVPVAATPGRTAATRYLRRVEDLDPEQRAGYLRDLTDELNGFLRDAGVLGRAETEGINIVRTEGNPAIVIRIPAGGARPIREGGKKGPVAETSPVDRRVLNTVVSIIGDALDSDAMEWFRPFYRREDITKQNGTRIVPSRTVTEDELRHLQGIMERELGGKVTFPPSPDGGFYVLNRSGAANRKFHDTLVKAWDEALPDVDADGLTFRFDGDIRTKSRYGPAEATTGFAGRSHVRDAADRLRSGVHDVRRRHLGDADDPAGIALGSRGVGGSPHLLGQTRQNDLLGAVEFLDSESGRRILYLTKQADVSTLMHELVGHGVREIATHYPKEFAAVERVVGAKLADWSVNDHERFAAMFERYLADGRAPAPELVKPMKRMKQSIRAIYGGIQNMHAALPTEVSILFDTYFGAFDDEQVFRVAQLSTKIPEDRKVARASTLFDFSSQELAALRRRNETRAYNRSIEKLEADILKFEGKPFDSLTPEEQERLSALFGEWQVLKAQQEMAKADRQEKLRRRIKDIEDAMADENGEAFEGALGALRSLATMREDILRTVFGDQYDATFTHRVDLLADWLVDQGHLEPTFQRGSAFYAPHLPEGGGKADPRRIDTPARALASGVIGRVDTSNLTLHRRNNLIRFQQGDIHTDPLVIFEAWQNAQAFAFIHELKTLMWQIGDDIRWTPELAERDDIYLINLKGVPTPNMRAARSTLDRARRKPADTVDAQSTLDALDGRDYDKLEATLQDYASDTLMLPKNVQDMIANGVDPFALELRAVPRNIVDTLFRPLRGSGSAAGQALDIGNTVARWSLIYANVPTYTAMNLIGNFVFLSAGSNPVTAAMNLIRASKIGMTNSKLRVRIEAETGENPAFAAVQRGRRGSRKWREREHKALAGISMIPDRYPRIAAWIYEARRMGYKSEDDMMRLLDAPEGSNLARSRDRVSERATELMVNFDRMPDWEKQSIARVLFIWPWIRGATAWPAHYVREYPFRAAAFSNVALTLDERRHEMLGDVASYREDLFPISKQGNVARVINSAPISPGGTAGEQAGILASNLRSLFSGEKVEAGNKLVDLANPVIQFLFEATTGTDSFGRPQSLQTMAWQNALSFVPFGTYGAQMKGWLPQSKMYVDKSRWAITRRKFGRIEPEQVSISRLKPFEAEEKKKLWQKTAKAKTDLLADAKKYLYLSYLPGNVERAVSLQQRYFEEKDEEVERVKDLPGYRKKEGETLTPLQEAEFAYDFLKRHAPGMADYLPSPDYIPAEALEDYANDIIYGSKERGVQGLLQPLEDFRSEISKAKNG